MYDYREEMKKNVLEAMRECLSWDASLIENDASDWNDALFTDDSVTGNGSGSYTFNSHVAKEYVTDNIDLAEDTVSEFEIEPKNLYNWEYMDVSIRCYLLNEAIEEVMGSEEYEELVEQYGEEEEEDNE